MVGKLARLLKVPRPVSADLAQGEQPKKERKRRNSNKQRGNGRFAHKKRKSTSACVAKEDSEDEEAEQQAEQALAGKSAYEALVGLFSDKQGKHGGVFKRLINEQDGDSQGSSDSEVRRAHCLRARLAWH